MSTKADGKHLGSSTCLYQKLVILLIRANNDTEKKPGRCVNTSPGRLLAFNFEFTEYSTASFRFFMMASVLSKDSYTIAFVVYAFSIIFSGSVSSFKRMSNVSVANFSFCKRTSVFACQIFCH